MALVWCTLCGTPMDVNDPHDNCPTCLGIKHLREALTDPCLHCSQLSIQQRQARLAGLEGETDCLLSNTATKKSTNTAKRKAVSHAPQKTKMPKRSGALTRRVDALSDNVTQIRELLLSMQPQLQPQPIQSVQPQPQAHTSQHDSHSSDEAPLPASQLDPFTQTLQRDDDTLSLAATDTLFPMDMGDFSLPEDITNFDSSATESGRESDDGTEASGINVTLPGTIRMALSKLNIEPLSRATMQTNRLCRLPMQSNDLAIPPCDDFIKMFTEALKEAGTSRMDRATRLLAAMAEPSATGLGPMPPVEPAVVSLVVSPDEALRTDPRCPSPECRRTDNLVCRAYNTQATMGRVLNTMAHVLLALQTTIQPSSDAAMSELVDTALQGIGALAKQCGKSMGLLLQARRQIWVAQSPLPDAARNVLRQLPLAPGQLFGPAAQEALNRRQLASETRSQHVKPRAAFKKPQPVPQPAFRGNPTYRRHSLPSFQQPQRRYAEHGFTPHSARGRPSSSFPRQGRAAQGRPPKATHHTQMRD